MRSPIVVEDRETGKPKYTLTEGRDGRWWCTCPSYKYGKHLADGARSCKHLERYVVDSKKDSTRKKSTRKKKKLKVHELRVLPHGFMSYKGCWLSEKMDGVFLRHSNGTFYTRSGRQIELPAYLTDVVPEEHEIDFELWCGRGNFALASRIVNEGFRPPKDQVHLVALDLVANGSYSSRYTELAELATEHGFEAVEQFQCNGPDDVVTVYSEVCANSGEGVVLRDIANDKSTRYETGRSGTSYKFKGAWIGRAYAKTPSGQGKWIFTDSYSGANFAMKIPLGLKVYPDTEVEFTSGFHPNDEPYRAAIVKAF